MTTITTSPTPQVGRTPLLVGIAVVGIVAVSVVAVPRLTATIGTTGTGTTAATNQHDAVEHGRDATVAGALAADRARTAAAEARTSAQVQRSLDLQGKQRTTRGTAASVVPASTLREQVGGLAPTFPYRPASTLSGVNGRDLVQVPATTSHTVWSDTFVPPYDDPEWMPLIKRHYGMSSSTSPETHQYR